MYTTGVYTMGEQLRSMLLHFEIRLLTDALLLSSTFVESKSRTLGSEL
jgi:hypothetical protein